MMPGDDLCGGLPPGDQFAALLAKEAREKAIPISGTFELTPRCNFNCKMCYVHLKEERISQFGRELTAEEWLRIAREAKEAGMLYLCITGGEPTLHPEFETIYRELAQMGFFITLQTNASTMKGKVLRLLEEYPPQMVKLTIYGSDDEMYRDVCEVEHGFAQVDAGIRALKQLEIPMLAVTTVIKNNKDDLANIHRYTQEMEIPWFYSSAVHPSIRGAETDADAVAIDEETATDFRTDVRWMIEHPWRKEGDKPCEHCKGYRNSFWITWDGKMRFCSFMDEPDIKLFTCTFKKNWQYLIDFEEKQEWPKACNSCEIYTYCRLCPGALSSLSGSTKKVNKRFCSSLKRYIIESEELKNGTESNICSCSGENSR